MGIEQSRSTEDPQQLCEKVTELFRTVKDRYGYPPNEKFKKTELQGCLSIILGLFVHSAEHQNFIYLEGLFDKQMKLDSSQRNIKTIERIEQNLQKYLNDYFQGHFPFSFFEECVDVVIKAVKRYRKLS